MFRRSDLRLSESEERRDDVSKGVTYKGHEGSDGHEWRRQYSQDGAPDCKTGDGADHHNGDHHYGEACLRRTEE